MGLQPILNSHFHINSKREKNIYTETLTRPNILVARSWNLVHGGLSQEVQLSNDLCLYQPKETTNSRTFPGATLCSTWKLDMTWWLRPPNFDKLLISCDELASRPWPGRSPASPRGTFLFSSGEVLLWAPLGEQGGWKHTRKTHTTAASTAAIQIVLL